MTAAVFIHNAVLNSAAASGAKCYTYNKNTTTPKTVYTNVGLTTAAANPVVSDADGKIKFYFDDTTNFTFVVKTSDGGMTLLEADYTASGETLVITYADVDNWNSFQEAIGSGDASDLTVTSTGGTSKTLAAWMQDVGETDSAFITPEDYGAVGDGVRKTTGVATASSTTFTDASGAFATTDIDKTIVLYDAGASVYVVTAEIASGGSGYVQGDVLTVAGGTGTASTWKVTAVDGSGVIQSIFPVGFGAYSAAPSSPNSATGGTGTGVSLTLTSIRCPVSHATTIAGRTSATQITLTSAPARSVSSNCEYVYGTNDTTAFQNVLDALTDGQGIVLRPVIYVVGNLKWPHLSDTTDYPAGMVCVSGSAQLVFAAATDTAYGIAPKRWITATKTSYSSSPFYARNVVFDGAFIVDTAVVLKNWQTELHECVIMGGKKIDVLLTRQNQDASDGATGSYQSECGLFGCEVVSKAQLAGIYVQGTASDDTDSSTDGYLNDVNVYCQGVTPYGIILGNTGGWKIDGGHTYNSTYRDVYIKLLNNLGSWSGATHEDLCTVEKVGSSTVNIGKNNFWEGIEFLFAADTSAETVLVDGLVTTTGRGGSAGQVFVRTSKANKVLVINNLTSRSATPVVIADQGTVIINNGHDGNGEIGIRHYDNGASAGPALYLDRISKSPASNDLMGHIVGRGRNASDAVTSYGLMYFSIGATTAGAENGRWTLQLIRGGSLVNIARAGDGFYVGASATDPGAGAINVDAGYYVGGTMSIDTARGIRTASYTSTQLNDIANAVNTANKATGKMVWNSTASKPVWAVGSTAGSVWVDGAGSTVNTPI